MPSNIRIAYIIYKLPPNLTGAGLRMVNYCSEKLIENRIPFIITKSGQLKPFLDYQTEYKNYSLPREMFREIYEPEIVNNYGSFIKLITYLISNLKVFVQLLFFLIRNSRKFDIIHITGNSTIALNSLFISSLLRKKTILELTLQNEVPTAANDMSLTKKLITRQKRNVYKMADKYIALSKALELELGKISLPSSRITILENSVDTIRYCLIDDPERKKLKKSLDIRSKHPVFIFVGALIFRKGIDILIKLICLLSKEYPDCVFLIVGENDKSLEQKKFHKELNEISESKHLIQQTGMVQNVEEYLQVSDYFIFPSRKEGLPNAVLEAMSSGIPVIMNSIEGISDFIIDNGKNGFIVNDNNLAQYQKIIRDLESNPNLKAKVSNNARSTVMSRFTSQKRNKKLENLYVELFMK